MQVSSDRDEADWSELRSVSGDSLLQDAEGGLAVAGHLEPDLLAKAQERRRFAPCKLVQSTPLGDAA